MATSCRDQVARLFAVFYSCTVHSSSKKTSKSCIFSLTSLTCACRIHRCITHQRSRCLPADEFVCLFVGVDCETTTLARAADPSDSSTQTNARDAAHAAFAERSMEWPSGLDGRILILHADYERCTFQLSQRSILKRKTRHVPEARQIPTHPPDFPSSVKERKKVKTKCKLATSPLHQQLA